MDTSQTQMSTGEMIKEYEEALDTLVTAANTLSEEYMERYYYTHLIDEFRKAEDKLKEAIDYAGKYLDLRD